MGTMSGITAGILLTGSAFTDAFADRVAGPFAARPAAAQQISPQVRQYFLSDPLTTEPRDPFLPVLKVDRPLSPLELSAVAEKVDALDNSAQQQLAAGEVDNAFLLWRRVLRLRRVLGPVPEFRAIIKVAQLAWDAQRPVEVQLLTLRTREIWETLQAELGVTPAEEPFAEALDADGSEPASVLLSGQTSSDITILNALAQTFTTLRDVDSAVEVYETLIAISEQQGVDPTGQRRSLAELHLQWFQFADAANIYLALLKTAQSSGNQAAEIAYLSRLIYSYQQAKSLTNAVVAQTNLLSIYQARGEEDRLPELLLAIAQNYRTLNQSDNAVTYYRAAYSAAQRLDQFSVSARVLKGLGALYQSLDLNNQALGAYSLLIPVEQQAYNTYGVMQAYDSIGQIQRSLGNSLEALKAFEQALALANQLGLPEDYFVTQIKSVP
ncbi:MAG: tetratricopeptide repeat protein [Phormidesmis sp.]